MSKYTIKDIAQRAGVSIGTVSRVLNRAQNVDEALRQKTLEAIRHYDFKPSTRGRRSGAVGAAKQVQSIAVVFPEMGSQWRSNVLWSAYVSGIEQLCRAQRLSCQFYFSDQPEAGQRILADGHAGVLLKTPDAAPAFLSEIAASLPLVLFGGYNPELPYLQVSFDNYTAGRILARHFLDFGHKRIVFVNHAPGNSMFRSRMRGFCDTLELAGLLGDDTVLLGAASLPAGGASLPEESPPQMDWVVQALERMSPRPTGVVFANDWAALGFYRACVEAGIEIPGRYSVAGVDDIGGMCQAVTPALSSLALPFARLAYVAAAQLAGFISDPLREYEPSVQYIPAEFHPRASVRRL